MTKCCFSIPLTLFLVSIFSCGIVSPPVPETVAEPSFDLEEGVYTTIQVLSISTTTEGALIYYTIDGSDPTASTGILYEGPIEIASSMTIKAVAYKDGLEESVVVSISITIDPFDLVLSKEIISLGIGYSQKLIAKEDGVEQTVIWSSNDSQIASVDVSGNVTGHSEGIAEITGSTQDGDGSASCTVLVTENHYFTIRCFANTRLSLPLVPNGTYDFTVNWGDGTESNVTAWDDAERAHEYIVGGYYDISISGVIIGWSYYNRGYSQSILEISNWGPLCFGDTTQQFYTCANLTITATDKPVLNFTNSLQECFRICHSLVKVPNISSWDTEHITDMFGMFWGCENYDQAIADLDTSSVRNMRHMFYECVAFNQDLSAWNTSNVIDMSYMFSEASSFNGSLSGWDTSSVEDMSYMFANASSFNQDLSGWDTSCVVDMAGMFTNATLFNGSLSGWDTSRVTDMSHMFAYTISFNQSLSSWDTSSVTNMVGVFNHAESFNGNLSAWDTSACTNMKDMFAYAKAFNGDISQWNTLNVRNMNYMLNGAEAFNQNIGAWDVSSVTTMEKFLQNAVCFDQDLSAWDISKVTDLRWFLGGGSLSTANYDALLIGWESLPYVQWGVSFSAGASYYSAGAAAEAKQRLIDDHGWRIGDAGQSS